MSNINLGPQDSFLSLATLALPAAGANNTTGVMDLECVGPFSDGKYTGLIAVTVPPLPNLVATYSITLQIQVAEPSLTASSPAPGANVPGAFANANPSQIITINGVAGGYQGGVFYFFIPIDSTGNTYQYVQVLQTAGAGATTEGEIVTYSFIKA